MSFKTYKVNKYFDRFGYWKDEIILNGAKMIDDEDSSNACFQLCCLYRQLSSLLEIKAADRENINQSKAIDENFIAPFWIINWAKSSAKNGFCYELCDRSIGILFDDRTQFIMDVSGEQARYIDQKNMKRNFSMDNWPDDLEFKKSLFQSFLKRRSQTPTTSPNECLEGLLDDIPRLRLWRMTKTALILQLTDGTVQINFLTDHLKIIFSPLLNSITLINQKRKMFTYRLQLLEKYGCYKDFIHRINHAKRMIELLILENNDCVDVLSHDGYEISRSNSSSIESNWMSNNYSNLHHLSALL